MRVRVGVRFRTEVGVTVRFRARAMAMVRARVGVRVGVRVRVGARVRVRVRVRVRGSRRAGPRQVVRCGELAVRVDVDLGCSTLVVGGACAQVCHVREVDLLVVGSPRVEGARHLWCHGTR